MMKRLLCVLLVVAMCFAAAGSFAEYDFSQMTEMEILDLIQQANEELKAREQNKGDSTEATSDIASVSTGAYSYMLDTDENATLISYSWDGFSSGADLIIPSEIDGHSVTSIGTYCFYTEYQKNIGSLVIPDSVVEIGYKAFYNLNVNHISLPKDVKTIEHGAFVVQFKSMTIDKGNAGYAVIDNALYEKSTKSLLAVSHQGTIIPEGIRIIGSFACYCIEPEEIAMSVIPSSVEMIEDYAFYKASLCFSYSECELNIPAKQIGDNAFEECKLWGRSLSKIILSFNPELKEIPKNCFLNASTKEFRSVKYWSNSKLDYVKTNDYFNCPCEIIFPDGLEVIGDFAFKGFSEKRNGFSTDAAEKITIKGGFPVSIRIIGDHCFERKGVIYIDSQHAFEKNVQLVSIGQYAFTESTLKTNREKGEGLIFVIPSTVISIGERALNISCDDDFYTVNLTAGINMIGNEAFDKQKAILMVEPDSYSEKWARQNAYHYESAQDDDLSWLND